jgi:hypothetical protein
VPRDEYLRRSAELDSQRSEMTTSGATTGSSFGSGPWCRRVVEDWPDVTLEERKRLVASIFEVITLDDTRELDWTPRESWKDYARAVIPATTGQRIGPIRGF